MDWSCPLALIWSLSNHDYNALKGGMKNSNSTEITRAYTERIHRAQEEKDYFVATTIFPVTSLPAICACNQHF